MTATAVVAGSALEEAPSRRSLWSFVAASRLQTLVLGTSKDPNAKVMILLVSSETATPVLAVKAPTTEAAARAVDTEERVLSEIGGLALGEVATTIPRVVDVVEFEQRPAVVMTAVPGTPMITSYIRRGHTARPEQVAADFAAIGDWLAALQAATAQRRAPLEMDAGVTSRLRARFAGDPLLAGDLDRLAAIHSRLRRNTLPRTLVHGDLWLGNVLLQRGRVSGIVDWECAVQCGEPVRDLVRFAHMYALYLDRRTRPGRSIAGHGGLRATRWGIGVEHALTGSGWFPELFRCFIGDGLTRLGGSSTSWWDAAVAGIAEVAAFTDHQDFARLHLELFRRLAQCEPLG
jgi:aminoglycoside phosphotransferase (APT) family kinase protein